MASTFLLVLTGMNTMFCVSSSAVLLAGMNTCMYSRWQAAPSAVISLCSYSGSEKGEYGQLYYFTYLELPSGMNTPRWTITKKIYGNCTTRCQALPAGIVPAQWTVDKEALSSGTKAARWAVEKEASLLNYWQRSNTNRVKYIRSSRILREIYFQ